VRLDDRDGLHFDEPAGEGEGGDADEGGGWGLLAEELFADGGKFGAVADIDEERREFDDVGELAAAGLDLGLEGVVGRAGLGAKISGVARLTLLVVVDLAGDEQDGFCARDFDRLGVGGRVEDAFCGKPFDLGCHDAFFLARSWAQAAHAGQSACVPHDSGEELVMSLLSEDVRSQLVAIYTGPDRHYHDLRHIQGMLALAEEHGLEITDGEAVEAAIWFHDAVYDTRRSDNEAESAKLATEMLSGVAAGERLEIIAAMIRASAKHVIPDAMQGAAAKDCALFLDMDLAILGSPVGEFDAYERAVQLEYGWVPDEAWITGRSKVLRNFLGRPFIYGTTQFRKSHEAAARSNLTRSLARLEGNLRS
jgi:predicted metal-dependent HD superfamily phosphohydrolase